MTTVIGSGSALAAVCAYCPYVWTALSSVAKIATAVKVIKGALTAISGFETTAVFVIVCLGVVYGCYKLGIWAYSKWHQG